MAVGLFFSPPLSAEWTVTATGTAQHLRGGWIAPDGSVFAVGDAGTILRFDGTDWSPMASGTTNDLYDVWGSSASNVVAAGLDRILLYDGAAWNPLVSEDAGAVYSPVWMTPTGGEVFVAGPSWTGGYLQVYHRDTGAWGDWGRMVGTVLALGGVSNDVTMVQTNGYIERMDNDLGTIEYVYIFEAAYCSAYGVPCDPSPPFASLQTAWINPAGGSEIFAADAQAAIYHFDGAAWTDMNAGIPSGTSLYAITGHSGTDVYAVGVDGSDNGVIWHYDGSGWTQESIPSIPGLIEAVAGSPVHTFGESGTHMYQMTAAADVAIEKSASQSGYMLGDVIEFTLRVTNNGPVDAPGVMVSDTFPSGLTLKSKESSNFAVVNFDAGSGALSANLGTIGNGATVTITVAVQAAAAGDFENTATVQSSASDPDETNNTSTFSYRVVNPEETDTSGVNYATSASSGDPVNMFTGELILHEAPDLSLAGPLPVTFQRYYASGLRRAFVVSRVGDNWRHNYDWTIHWVGNVLVIKTDKGRIVRYLKPDLQSNVWLQQNNPASPYEVIQIAAEEETYFFVRDPDTNRILKFSVPTGFHSFRLTQIEDGRGNRLTLTYNDDGDLSQVADGLGRTLTFTYDENADNADRKLRIVSDGARSVHFTFDGDLLTQVEDPEGNFSAYAYDTAHADSGLLWYKTLPGGDIPLKMTWSAEGKVATQTDADNNAHTFTYAGPTSSTITDPKGDFATFVHNTGGALASRTDAAGKTTTVGSDSSQRRTSVLDKQGGLRSMTYAPGGGLASVTDENSQTVSYSYSTRTHTASGLTFQDLSGILYPDGTTETFSYDANGSLTSHTDRTGNTWTYTNNARGQRLTAANPAGGVSTYSYDGFGNLASVADAVGNTTWYAYDTGHRLVTITRPDSTTRTFTYNSLDKILSITNENGHSVAMTYDPKGNLHTVQNALGHTITYTYDSNDRIAAITDPLGNTINRTYDELGRLKTQTDPLANTATIGYDSRGRLTTVTDPAGNIWRTAYNDNDLPTAGTNPESDARAFVYDAAGNATSVTSGSGKTTAYTYDSDRRITSVTDPLGNTTAYDFDANGRIIGITLPGGSGAAAYTRNSLGLITSVEDPLGHKWAYAYDNQGRLISSTDPLGNVTSCDYDNRNRLSTVTYPGGGTQTLTYDGVANVIRRLYTDATDINYTYDATERLTSADNLSFAYDAKGRMTDSNGIGATYDALGRITAITLAAGRTITYAYNSLSQLTSVTDWTGGSMTFAYDNAGRMLMMTRPNGLATTIAYDGDGNISSIAEGALSRIDFTRDGNGHVVFAARNVPLAPAIKDAVTTFGYDAASQASGNTYDGMGRLTGDATRTYTWDLASRLTGYSDGAATVAFTHDAFGGVFTRTEAGTTRQFGWNFILSRLPVISVLKEGGTDLRYFVHTPQGTLLYSIEAVDNSRHFYHFDETGNTLFLTNDSGIVTNRYAYTPYGNLAGSSGTFDNLFTYGGRFGVVAEGKGLFIMWQRIYDSDAMRFISRDPIAGRLYPHAINPYQYAVGNPITYIDPMGAFPTMGDILNAGKEAVGAIGGAAGIVGHYVGEAAEHAGELAGVFGNALSADATPKDINIVTKFVRQADKLEKASKALDAAGNVGSAMQAASVIQEGVRLKDAFERVNQEYGERIANAWIIYNTLFREAGIAYKNKRWTEGQLKIFLIQIRWNLELELLHAGFDRDTDAWLNLMVGVKNMAATFIPVPFLSDIISPESDYPGVH